MRTVTRLLIHINICMYLITEYFPTWWEYPNTYRTHVTFQNLKNSEMLNIGTQALGLGPSPYLYTTACISQPMCQGCCFMCKTSYRFLTVSVQKDTSQAFEFFEFKHLLSLKGGNLQFITAFYLLTGLVSKGNRLFCTTRGGHYSLLFFLGT